MQEMQEDFYLVLFMLASQLYFYVLGPSSLLGYQYFNIWKQGYFRNKAIRVSYTIQIQGLAIIYKQTIILILEIVDILIDEKNSLLVSLRFGVDFSTTLGVDSKTGLGTDF